MGRWATHCSAIIGRAARVPDRDVHDPAQYRCRAVDWATGAALMVRRRILTMVGAWDADRFFLYSEETDYAGASATGGRSGSPRTPSCATAVAGSGSSPELDALLELNKLRYYRKWHPRTLRPSPSRW